MIINCPKCGKKTALTNDTCEHCGIKVKHCPECQNVVEENQTLCDYCGYTFGVVNNEEKGQDKMPKELKKTAVKLASFAEQENKKYNKIAKVLSPIGWILLFLAAVLPIIIIKTSEDIYLISKISTIDKLNSVFLIISLMIIFVSCIFKELRSSFSYEAIMRQVRALNFDYKKYYSYDDIEKNLI